MGQFNRHKFKELVLYIAAQLEHDPKFGATKLNKILFFSDFLAYAHFGEPITGAVYQRLQKGPAPRMLVPVRNELVEDGDAKVETRTYFHRTQDRVVALRPADMSHFSVEEKALVDEVIDQLKHHDAVSISDLSHDVSMAWQAAMDGEEIPYETVFVSIRPPSPSDIARGQELAEKYGW
jgi:hypothetical protein